LGLEQVHQFLLLRNAERKAEFDAYTDRLMKIGVLASTAPVLAYAGVGSLLGALGAELTGTAAALQGAATVGPLGIGIYQIQQGLAAGDQALIAEGLMNGLSAGAFLGEGLGAGPRAAAREAEGGGPFVPGEYWTRPAPHQVEPGTIRLDHTRLSGRTNRIEESIVVYDQYGRIRFRVDKTDHLRPDSHTNPHLHEFEYAPGFTPFKENLHNIK